MGTNKTGKEFSGMPVTDNDMGNKSPVSEQPSNVVYLKFPGRPILNAEADQSNECLLSQIRQEVSERLDSAGNKLFDEFPNRIINLMIRLGIIKSEDIIKSGKRILIKTKDGFVTPEECLRSKAGF